MHSSTHLYLLRHGEVEERYHRIFGGRIDMNLSPLGHEQAAALARHLRKLPLDAIYASPMRRAQQTLAPLDGHAPTPTVVRDELREVHFGDWTGLTWEEVWSQFNVHASSWLHQMEEAAIPNGESGAAFRARIEPCLRDILKEQAGKSTAIVCHGGVIRMMLAILIDLPLPKLASFEIDYASVTHVELRPHLTEVRQLNFAPWRHG